MQIQQHNPLSYRVSVIPFILALVVLPMMQRIRGGQEPPKPSSLAQTAAASGPEMKAFRDGRELLEEEKWARAAERFNDYITDYPNDANVDAALYWLAFALKKQDKFLEADRALQRLTTMFPASRWADDAKALRIEIAPRLGNAELIDKEAKDSSNDEAKLIALRNLFATNPDQAVVLAANIFTTGSDASRSFKESAITMLGRHGGKQAWPLLIDIARHESDTRLRKAAIYWLGKEEDANTLAALKDQALTSAEADVGLAAVSSILQQGSPQALESLGDIAKSATSPEVRKQAEALLRADTGISFTSKKDSWLLVKGNKQLLLISTGRIIKLTGLGNLKFKRDGQLIEIPNGLGITVNGESAFKEGEVRKNETADVVGGEITSRERLIHGNETVRLVGEGQRTMWELSLVPTESASMLASGNWFTINGEFNVSAAELKTFFLYAKPGGGVKMR
jgi:hypothetical protein